MKFLACKNNRFYYCRLKARSSLQSAFFLARAKTKHTLLAAMIDMHTAVVARSISAPFNDDIFWVRAVSRLISARAGASVSLRVERARERKMAANDHNWKSPEDVKDSCVCS